MYPSSLHHNLCISFCTVCPLCHVHVHVYTSCMYVHVSSSSLQSVYQYLQYVCSVMYIHSVYITSPPQSVQYILCVICVFRMCMYHLSLVPWPSIGPGNEGLGQGQRTRLVSSLHHNLYSISLLCCVYPLCIYHLSLSTALISVTKSAD